MVLFKDEGDVIRKFGRFVGEQDIFLVLLRLFLGESTLIYFCPLFIALLTLAELIATELLFLEK